MVLFSLGQMFFNCTSFFYARGPPHIVSNYCPVCINDGLFDLIRIPIEFFMKLENVSLEISFWVVVFFSGTLNKNEARPRNGAGKEKWEVGLLRFTRSFLMREELSESERIGKQPSEHSCVIGDR